MNDKKIASRWMDERRWDYTHAVLSLDLSVPLYAYMGLPFQDKARERFTKILIFYVQSLYLERTLGNVTFIQKRRFLLDMIDREFVEDYKSVYVAWLLQVFKFRPQEEDGWDDWTAIFMKAELRPAVWDRLVATLPNAAAARVELRDTKARIEDARELRNELAGSVWSRWDRSVLQYRRFDEQAKEAGEPFSRLMLTARFFLFSAFWKILISGLKPAQVAVLWGNGRAVAAEMGVRPESLVDPSSLVIAKMLPPEEIAT